MRSGAILRALRRTLADAGAASQGRGICIRRNAYRAVTRTYPRRGVWGRNLEQLSRLQRCLRTRHVELRGHGHLKTTIHNEYNSAGTHHVLTDLHEKRSRRAIRELGADVICSGPRRCSMKCETFDAFYLGKTYPQALENLSFHGWEYAHTLCNILVQN